MTHAALQDLLTRALPFLREAAEPFEDDGGNEPLELARAIECALESPAALSAMEGEDSLSPSDMAMLLVARCLDMNVGTAEYRFEGLTDEGKDRGNWRVMVEQITAPPPQQAGKLREIGFGKSDECPPEFCAPPMSDEERTARINELKGQLAKAHPTPSPGPQGGDNALIMPVGSDALAWMKAESLATPPQPEAANWRSDIKTLIDNGQVWHDASQDQACAYVAARDRLMKAIDYAALTTSGRDGE